jgi:T-complex protein 1 subunit zeta
MCYSNAEERAMLLASERKLTDDKCRKIIEFKKRVCTEENGKTFVVLNQKGIDQPCLDMMAKEGMIGLRRIKRRNLERIVRACGGVAMNTVDDLDVSDLGTAGLVYEKVLGDDKWTFIEEVPIAESCTVMIRGPNDHTIHQIKDALRDGLRSVSNTMEDKHLVPGGGSFEVACANHLQTFKDELNGKVKLGVDVFANALLIIPKMLATNSGFDTMDTLLKLQEEHRRTKGPVGLDVVTGECMNPVMEGIYDNYCVKKQLFNLGPVLAQQLILVDEVIRAGRQMKGG